MDISLPRFLKSIAVVGDATPGPLHGLMRVLGFYCWYWKYIRLHPIFDFEFQHPPPAYYDPTEIGQFSNIVGRAFADYFARLIDGTLFTHTYEAALVVKNEVYSGSRPDLFCDTGTRQFSIEAKGYSASLISDVKMEDYKKQACSGPLPVHFCVASVTYNLFRNPTCKYYDPILEDAEYDWELSLKLARQKMTMLLNAVQYFARPQVVEIGNYVVGKFLLPRKAKFPVFLLISKHVKLFLDDKTRLWEPIKQYEESGVFLDKDGIGIQVGEQTSYIGL